MFERETFHCGWRREVTTRTTHTHTHTDGGGRIDPRGYEVTVLDPTERTLSPARGHYADGRGKRLKDQDVENDNESQPWYPANNKEGFLLGTK